MPNERPFAKLTFCCTGISLNREDLAEKIEALGGVHYSDLMSDVKYLIVGDRDTAKYNFCIKNRVDIRFLNRDAILKVYSLWLKGEDDSSKLDINNYSLEIFGGMQVCFSRIELDLDDLRRVIEGCGWRKDGIKAVGPPLTLAETFSTKNLVELIHANGGKSSGSLTISNTCVVTTEKRGKRYTKALEWKKPVIHPLWIVDSILRGAALDFEDYILNDKNENSLYDKGCNVWNQCVGAPVEINEEIYQEDKPKKVLKKNTTVWNSIMDTTKHLSKRVVTDSAWDEEEKAANGSDDDLPTFVRAKKHQQDREHALEAQLFLGSNFLLVGFSAQQQTLLTQVIESHHGEVTMDSTDDTITHIIVPASAGAQASMMLRILSPAVKARISNGDIKAVTEWYIERSMYYKRPMMDRWGQPMKGLVRSTKKFKVCITGFTGIELLHIEKLVEYLGFEFCKALTLKRDLLVMNINLFKNTLVKNSPKLYQYKFLDVINCPTYLAGSTSVLEMSSKNKINAAKKWQIPIVSVAYLWETMELSANKATLIMPNIVDLTWCLYAPSKYSRPQTLMEYVKNMSTEEEEHASDEPSSRHEVQGESYHDEEDSQKRKDDDSIRLPSPRKAVKRQKYGRLAGREQQGLLNKLIDADSPTPDESLPEINPDITNEDDDFLSQIQYQDAASLKNDEELRKKLSHEELPVRRRTRQQNK
jgi:DNA replication regulator DPB11